MSDINNYDDDYIVDDEELDEEYDEEYEEQEKNPEKFMKLIIGAVVVAAVVIVVLVCILFGSLSGKDNDSTTLPGEGTSASEEGTSESDDKFAPGAYTVTVPDNGNLNLREDADMEAEALIAIPHGTLLNISEVKLVVTELNEEQYWGKTTHLGWNGWVAMAYLTKSYSQTVEIPSDLPSDEPEQTTEAAAVPEQTTVAPEVPEQTTAAGSTSTGKPNTAGTYTVDVDPDPGKINMRDDHSVNANQITSIPAGTEITILEVYHNEGAEDKTLEYWGKVSYSGYTGWVSMWYLK